MAAPQTISLDPGTFLATRLARGACIRCQAGELLVTLEGVIEDFHLMPGQTLCLPRRGKAVVEALSAAALLLD